MRRPGYLHNFGQFIINTAKRTPSITMNQADGCPLGFQTQCVGGLPCQNGYERYCTQGTGFPCICIK